MGILREEELQELAVVIEAVEQPSSVVDWGRESDGCTFDSYREHSEFFFSEVACVIHWLTSFISTLQMLVRRIL